MLPGLSMRSVVLSWSSLNPFLNSLHLLHVIITGAGTKHISAASSPCSADLFNSHSRPLSRIDTRQFKCARIETELAPTWNDYVARHLPSSLNHDLWSVPGFEVSVPPVHDWERDRSQILLNGSSLRLRLWIYKLG